MRRGRIALAVLAAAGAAVAAFAPAAGAQMTEGQAFFTQRLLDDPQTSRNVAELLRGEGFVDRSVAFRDLTGDKKPEALVRVQSGGAAGTVAIYVFSTDTGRRGSGLQAVFRSQKLYRGFTTVDDEGVLSYATARYAPGNALCCPAMLQETSLRWDDRRHRFVIGRRTEAPGPVVPAA
jgi:hypothetical protein